MNAVKATPANILAALVELTNNNVGEYLTWQQLSDAVRAAGLKVTNWVHVRVQLSALVNGGALVRDTTDLTVERYLVRGQVSITKR